jgi:hypothetical protein
MPTSRHWQYTEDDDSTYLDDDGNIIYYDRQGKLKKYKATNLEYQQQYHYYETDN